MDYAYKISADITAQKVAVGRLTQEIAALLIAGFQGVKADLGKDSVTVIFKNPIVGPDKTALDNTVKNTSGVPLEIFDALTVPIWQDSSTLPANHPPAIVFCINQNAYFTSDGSTWTQL